MGWPKDARKWSRQEILRDVEQAKELFRQRRLEEPKERYLEAFKSLERANKKVVELLPGLLADPVDPRLLSSLIREEDLLTALRYLGAPPISTDDLETLLSNTLAPTLIAQNSDRAKNLVDILRRILDPKRFPWIYENRPASRSEKNAAVLASCVAASAQRVQTSRRSLAWKFKGHPQCHAGATDVYSRRRFRRRAGSIPLMRRCRRILAVMNR